MKHIVSNSIGEITTQTNSTLNKMLADIILNKTEIKKLDILNSSLFGDQPVIENYYGNNREEKITDFCDRYWNLMHGWKKRITLMLMTMIKLFNIGFTKKQPNSFLEY